MRRKGSGFRIVSNGESAEPEPLEVMALAYRT